VGTLIAGPTLLPGAPDPRGAAEPGPTIGVVNPLQVLSLPVLVGLRAVDDLHAIATAARRLTTLEQEVLTRMDGLVADFHRLTAVAERIDGQLPEAIAAVDRLTRMAGEVDEAVPEAVSAVKSLTAVAAEFEQTVPRASEALTSLAEVAERLDDTAPDLAAAVPTIQQLTQSAETLAAAVLPLQGAAERLGSIADRLPGGGRTRHQAVNARVSGSD
jgi:ABC-type transporter Mla subunit MlaD